MKLFVIVSFPREFKCFSLVAAQPCRELWKNLNLKPFKFHHIGNKTNNFIVTVFQKYHYGPISQKRFSSDFYNSRFWN